MKDFTEAPKHVTGEGSTANKEAKIMIVGRD